jgi:hypothetical protein
MRKLILLLLTVGLITCKTPKNGQREKDIDSLPEIKKKILTNELVVDTARPVASADTSSIKKDTVSVQNEKGEIYIVYKKEDELKFVKDWLPLIISFLGWAAAIATLVYIHREYLRNQRHKNLEFLSEVDKMLVNDPKLWAIYDRRRKGILSSAIVTENGNIEITGKEEVNIKGEMDVFAKTHLEIEVNGIVTIKKNGGAATQISPGQIVKLNTGEKINLTALSNTNITLDGTAVIEKTVGSIVRLQDKTDKELDDKLEAFCYYKINNFESVFAEGKKKGKVYETWRYYMVHTIMRSGIFKKTVGEAINGKLYEPGYTKLLREFVTMAEKLKPYYDSFKNKQIGDDEYQKKIDEIVSPH